MTGVLAYPRAATAAIIAGCVLLVARPPLLRAGPDPTTILVVVFVALLIAGATWPAPAEVSPEPGTVAPGLQLGALAIGIGAFALGRVLGGGHAPAPFAVRVVVLNSLAAVAEEAFFRRLVYGGLLPGGAAVAVGGSALLFALVHVTVYGVWVLPIDLAAGLVLSWQRLATGSWRVPALTHVVANVLVVI